MKAHVSYQRKTYDLERSPLYQLSSKRKLAELVGIELRLLSALLKAGPAAQYQIFTDKKTLRFITEPIGDRAIIHEKLAKLLARITPPDYIHSATKKRSYKTNAEMHIGGDKSILKIDIKKFFPSIQFDCIHRFFLTTMLCAPDIATILAKICTVKTELHGIHLPTGSTISPILSFYANKPLFDSIRELCRAQSVVFTAYVDDITVSGENASKALLTQIAIKIHNAGYGYHKIKSYVSRPAIVTGLVVANGKIYVPHIRMKKIRELNDSLAVVGNDVSRRHQILSSLVGRLSEAEHINPAYKSRRQEVLIKYADDWRIIADQRAAKARLSLRAQKYKSAFAHTKSES